MLVETQYVVSQLRPYNSTIFLISPLSSVTVFEDSSVDSDYTLEFRISSFT